MFIQPNQSQACLNAEAAMTNAAMLSGGFVPTGCCPSTRNADPPWLTMPIQGRPIAKVSSLTIAELVAGDNVVVSYQVPPGFDLAIVQISNQFTGAGFVEGSGDIIWRLRVSNRYPRNFGNILNTYGSTEVPWAFPRSAITARQNNLVQYLVNVPGGGFGIGDRVVCGIYGWIYPTVPPGF